MSTQISRTPASPALRRLPKQVRGQRRVEQLLEEAERTFAEIGFEQTTTNMIAIRAGVSIGSLYQFFSSKEAILEAMAERYVEQMRQMLQSQLAELNAENFHQRIDGLLRLIVKRQDERPYFLQCLSANRLSPVLERVVEEMNTDMTEHVTAVLVRLGADPNSSELSLRARMVVETMGALLPLAVRSQGAQRQRALTEIRTMLTTYIEAVVTVRQAS